MMLHFGPVQELVELLRPEKRLGNELAGWRLFDAEGRKSCEQLAEC